MNWIESLPALATFAFVSSITPGPNNLLLLDAGARFGLRRTMPALLGVMMGFQALLAACYLGVGALLLQVPAFGDVLALACGGYLAWLALRTYAPAREAPAGAPRPAAVPPTWLTTAGLQFVNPKAWGMTLTGAGIFAGAGEASMSAGAALLAVFAMVGIPCNLTWAAGGAALRPLLTNEVRLRRFSLAMAGLLLLTAVWVALPAVPGP